MTRGEGRRRKAQFHFGFSRSQGFAFARMVSPLIAFQQIGQLQLLHALFTKIAVPSAVACEIQPSVPRLLRQGFWVAPRLVQETVVAAGEVTEGTAG